MCSCAEPDNRIPIIIDADTANEVDDLFAIYRAINAPELNIKAINSAQFHTSPLASDTSVLESQWMNRDIIQLMKRTNIPLPIGSNGPLTSINKSSQSPASNFIVETAKEHSPEDPLNVVVLGSCTNVASAIIQDPSIIPNISVHYIGFWHDTLSNVFDRKEFNSENDTLAVEILMSTKGLDFNVMTATTCQHLVFDKEQVFEKLGNRGGMEQYLLDRWNTYDRWWTKDDPDKLKWIMWDVAIIEALIHPEMATKRSFSTKPDNSGRVIEAYTDIDVDAMTDVFWKSAKLN
jgi:inosine-uridine nucleoside N-ribohydrolase